MRRLVTRGLYSFDFSAKIITLTGSFAAVPAEEIESIFNATRGNWIYNPKSTQYSGNHGPGKQYYPLKSVVIGESSSVITYTAPNHEKTTNDDILLIIVDDLQPIDVNVTMDTAALITSSLVFAAGDVLTTEKLTTALTMSQLSSSGNYMFSVTKPVEDTAGDLTLKLYNQVKTDGTNSTDQLVTLLTVEKITGTVTNRSFLVSGLGIGNGTIKIGGFFAADSGAITVNFTVHAV